ncbi:IS110 family transposase [Methylocystis hirsuta]|uniref:IS110 family transposase n=1 Tax=Methylocystis hirsuta TaxID=369798 RepID=A0A3M9XJS8_9HYPH|nr:transposase [Methylocystis hirsuta]RNJ48015.1 IS110 family transposase [Methylocystis hirsuta]
MQGKALPDQSAQAQVYVGVDVCKDWLDVYFHPLGKALRIANDRHGLKHLKRACEGVAIARLVLEATGKYHRQAHRSLHAAGLPVAVVNPLRSRLFAEAVGALAKTDRIDARMLALLGARLDPAAAPPAGEAMDGLQELVRARQSAVADKTALSNRAGEAETDFLRVELVQLIAEAERHIARLDEEIGRRIDTDERLAERFRILLSIKGVGPIAAMTLLSCLGEIGACSGKGAAMLAGLAPIARDSGDKNGQRRIRGGRAHVRTALYMAAVAAARWNPDLAAFYKRLRENGKAAKIAITAVMRKIVVLANVLIRENRQWTPTRP